MDSLRSQQQVNRIALLSYIITTKKEKSIKSYNVSLEKRKYYLDLIKDKEREKQIEGFVR